jgi:hypothetical protein
MTKEDIIRMAREAGFADGVAEIVGLEGFANYFADNKKALEAALAQPEQKPVAWMVKLGDVTCFQHHADSKHASVPLYTTPPPAAKPEQVDCPRCGHVCSQRPWVGLEAEDLAQIESDEFWQVGNHMAIAMAVEVKLKERNNG